MIQMYQDWRCEACGASGSILIDADDTPPLCVAIADAHTQLSPDCGAGRTHLHWEAAPSTES